MNVEVIGVSTNDAMAAVNGVRVRIRRNTTTVRRLCDEYDESQNPYQCAHTAALANTPTEESS